jgi:hypothetical protein
MVAELPKEPAPPMPGGGGGMGGMGFEDPSATDPLDKAASGRPSFLANSAEVC